ncbi:MAG: glycerate kinase [Rhodospirillaceae bacterium TMED167]|nr:glycerate kinase [Rhodospirillaceae bacterium]OUW25936.1 MAG: glycerate kinase [Rhodospirillaceae bacterium TMED167]
MRDPGGFLRSLFDTAIAAAQPALCVPPNLPAPPVGRTLVIGAGKASAAMAATVEAHWNGPLDGLVVSRYGFAQTCDQIEVLEAAHPVPDAAGLAAAKKMLALVKDLSSDDLVLCLMSGGGSALLTLPARDISLHDKQTVNDMLLRCGAPISEVNTVRKHLSAVKGGRLGAACAPARLHTLIISDVPGDDPAMVASGPTIPDGSLPSDALAVLVKYDLQVPASVRRHLTDQVPEPVHVANASHYVIASASQSLEAAAAAGARQGLGVTLLGDAIEGDSRRVGRDMARRVQVGEDRPHLYLSGGETTVTLSGTGTGGPNTEFLLGLALELNGAAGIHALACDTDGIDGSGDNAGALVTPDTLRRAAAAGMDPAQMLDNNDAHGFFAGLGDLITSGPTHTNVNDFRAILVE